MISGGAGAGCEAFYLESGANLFGVCTNNAGQETSTVIDMSMLGSFVILVYWQGLQWLTVYPDTFIGNSNGQIYCFNSLGYSG
jgi:hypothetical protein